MVRLSCPSCQTKSTIDDSYVGSAVTCPGCRKKFQVPNSFNLVDIKLRGPNPSIKQGGLGLVSSLIFSLGFTLLVYFALFYSTYVAIHPSLPVFEHSPHRSENRWIGVIVGLVVMVMGFSLALANRRNKS